MIAHKVSLELSYAWSKPNLQRLLDVIRATGLPFIGTVSNIWGSIKEPGDIQIEHSITSLEECDSLLDLPKSSLYLSIYSSSSVRSLNFDVKFASESMRITVEVETEYSAIARQLLLDFGQALGAQTLLTGDEQLRLVSAERRYQYPKPVKVEEFLDLLAWVEAKLPYLPTNVGLNYRTPGVRRSPANLQQLKEELVQHWSDIEEIWFWLSAPAIAFTINVYTDQQELNVEISTPTQIQVDTLFNELQSQFQLGEKQKADETSKQKHGESRRYFTRQSLDESWLTKAISLMNTYFKSKIYFIGRYSLEPTPTHEVFNEDFAVWQNNIIENWSQLVSASMWFDQKELRVEIWFDPLRDQVQLRIEATDITKVDALFDQFQQDLELEPIPTRVYGRKTSGEYEIQGWRKERFAQAVKTALQQYVGEKFALTEAYLDVGPTEKRETEIYTSCSEFLQRLRGGDEYSSAKLAVEGPQGKALAIETYDEHQKLYIGSTFEKSDFKELEGLFNKSLGLTKISDENEKQPEKSKKQVLMQDVLKILITALVTFLLSSFFWANIFPKYSLQITLPQVAEGETLVIQTTEFPVEWALESEQWFQKKIYRNSFARIRVLKDGITPTETLYTQQSGKTNLELAPGLYTIEIVSDISQQEDTIKVSIQPPSNQP